MRVLAVVVTAAAFASGASAHHSTALVYHRDGAIIEAEGVITEVAWVNPHVRFKMRGAGADGVERVWDIESNSVSTVSRFGLTAELVAVGNRVKVAGNGGRNADNILWLTNMMLPSGQEILFGAAVKPRWSEVTVGGDIRSAVAADSNNLGLYRIWTNATNPAVFWGNDLPLTASAAAARAAFDPLADEPTANCAPKGMPFIMEQPYPMELVAAGDEILIRMEEYDTVRRIAMAERRTPRSRVPTLLGCVTRPLGWRRARRDDDRHRLPVVQRYRHSARSRRNAGRAVRAERGRQPARLHDDGHRFRDVHGARDVAQSMGVAARRAATAVRVSSVSSDRRSPSVSSA